MTIYKKDKQRICVTPTNVFYIEEMGNGIYGIWTDMCTSEQIKGFNKTNAIEVWDKFRKLATESQNEGGSCTGTLKQLKEEYRDCDDILLVLNGIENPHKFERE